MYSRALGMLIPQSQVGLSHQTWDQQLIGESFSVVLMWSFIRPLLHIERDNIALTTTSNSRLQILKEQ